MRVLPQQQPCSSKLNKKGAVIDIDILVAYLLFVSTIVLMVNYALGLAAPFSTSIESIEKERNTLTVRDLLITNFDINDFEQLCNINYVNLRRIAVTYEVKGFEMPYKDSDYQEPGWVNGSLVFWRDNKALHVMTGSNGTQLLISAEIIVPDGASVTNVSLESGDSFDIDYDSFNNLVVYLDTEVSDGDVDEIIIKPVNGIVSFKVYGLNTTNVYIGSMPASDYCGTKGITGPRTSFNRYGLMSGDRTKYYIKLTGDLWWTS